MKKAISFLFAAAILCSLSLPCFAADSFKLTVGEAEPTDSCDVVGAISVSADSSLYTTEFTVKYDSDLLEYVKDSGTLGAASAAVSPYFSVTQKGKGELYVSYTGTKPLNEGGILCTLGFQSRSKAATTAEIKIDVDHAETFDGEHIRRLDCTAQGGSLSVPPAETDYNTAALIIGCGTAIIIGGVFAILAVKKKNGKNN